MVGLTKKQKKLLFLVFAGAFSLILQVIGGFQLLEFTDSTAFCGQLCHEVMYPEYTAYEASPHSRVLCSDCHVGPGADYLVRSKVRGVPQIAAVAFNTYPRPVDTPVDNLRPARDTCERCHWPDRFSGDIIRKRSTFDSNEANSEKVITRVLKVGGGKEPIARDIHWHIVAKVWYAATDKKLQNIVWVGVQNRDGSLTEYIDQKKTKEVTPERIASEKRLMDCIDCHNRATHIFWSPEELIDKSMVEGTIDKSLPYVKREAVSRLVPASPSLNEAYARVETIRDFYRNSYPQISTSKAAAINDLVKELKRIGRLTTFPDMKVDWNTHIDNSSHEKYPGCFRCHGKLVETAEARRGRPIDATCDSCHYSLALEQVLGPNVPHTVGGRDNCLSCHAQGGVRPVPSDHEGRPNATCIICHKPATIQAARMTHKIEGQEDCLLCHGQQGFKPYPLDHVGRTNITCTSCHQTVR